MVLKFRWETEFKETEIGEIPKEWEVRKIEDVFEIIRGVSFTSSDVFSNYFNNAVALLRANNINIDGSLVLDDLMFVPIDFVREEQLLRKFDLVVVASSGNKDLVGKFTQINDIPYKLTFGAFNFCLRPIAIDKIFAKFVISSKIVKNQLEEVVDGTNINNLKKSDLGKFRIVFPPLPEQSRIATVLSWFDDLIENKKKQNEILEKTAMAIFKNWFIDFEPFKGEEFVFNEELGMEIPKRWEARRLGEVAELNRGLTFKSEEAVFNETVGYIPVLKTNNIKSRFEIDFSDLMFIKSDKVKDSKKILKEKDILIVGSNGNPDLVGNFSVFINFCNDVTFSFGAFVYLLRVQNPNLFSYIYLSLSDVSFREYIMSVIGGTNINNLSLNDLKNFVLPFPPSPVLQKFHSLVEPLFQKIILNQKQIMTLRKIRDTLLPLLVFGKLRVEEI